MSEQAKKIKFTTCKFCNQNDLMWEQHNGKFVLFESYGLPHQCDKLEQVKADNKARDQKMYQDFKTATMAKVGQKCGACGGHGILLGAINGYGSAGGCCFECEGTGVMTERQAKHLITQKRYQIWPSLKFSYRRR